MNITKEYLDLSDNKLYVALTDRIKTLYKKPRTLIDIKQYGIDGDITSFYSGVPEMTVITKSDNGTIYRHYSDSSGIDTIIHTHSLVSGKLPYASVSEGSKTYYIDLIGIMFTLSNVPASEVGVPHSNNYVDFYIEGEVPFLQLPDNRNKMTIFLIPRLENQDIKINIKLV